MHRYMSKTTSFDFYLLKAPILTCETCQDGSSPFLHHTPLTNEAYRLAIQASLDRFLACNKEQPQSDISQLAPEFLSEDFFDVQGFSLLHRIVLNLHGMDLKTCIHDAGIDIDIQDANGRTPLVWAAWRGDTRALRVLLLSGADVNKPDNAGFTPLSRAVHHDHLDAVRILLKAGASLDPRTTVTSEQAVHLSRGNKDLRILKELVAHGANLNSPSKNGTTMHGAAMNGSLERINFLVSRGTNLNALDAHGDLPALDALYYRQEAAFIHLAELGADIDIRRKSGENILHLATWIGSVKVWEYLGKTAEAGRLRDVNVGALHEGHDLRTCFSKCRGSWYAGDRDLSAEERCFERMLERITQHQSVAK